MSDLKPLEEFIKYNYTKELQNTLVPLNRKDIESKLILSTIGNFNFEEFKKGILDDFGF